MEQELRPEIRILIAEPLAVVRAGLRALLAAEPGFTPVGETGDGSELFSLVARLRPDVLVLEPGLPGPPPEQLLAEIGVSHPALKVLILAHPQDAPAAISLLDAGSAGCFLKSDRPDELLRGIRSAMAGELSLSSAVARSLLGKLSGPKRPLPVDILTEREREILDLLTDGLCNKEIAQRLYLSVRTVEVHLRNVYAKLGVRSRLEAVTRAARRDLL